MRSTRMIQARIKKLKADTRLEGKPALVQINAPLALIQVELKAGINALEWVLNARPKKKIKAWKMDLWVNQTLKTEMMGSVERAVEEVERRYDGKDMPGELAIPYDDALHAIEDYETYHNRPPRSKLWKIYYDLAKKLEGLG